MNRVLPCVVATVVSILVFLAFGAALNRSAGTGQPNLRPYVRTSQLGLGRAALAQVANAEIAAAVRRARLTYIGSKILSERLDGDRGTVVLAATFDDGGMKQRTVVFTLIFHRTVWSLGSLVQGAPRGMAQ